MATELVVNILIRSYVRQSVDLRCLATAATWSATSHLHRLIARNNAALHDEKGSHDDARGFRWFNTMKQASMYDREGEYVRHWIPELADVPKDDIHRPWEMHPAEQSWAGCTIGVHYPTPIVDLFKSTDHHEEIYNSA